MFCEIGYQNMEFGSRNGAKRWKWSQNGTQSDQNGAQRVPTGAKKEPKGSQNQPTAAKMEPKGRQNRPKATKMEPKGCQKGAKWRPKCIQKSADLSRACQNILKRGRFTSPYPLRLGTSPPKSAPNSSIRTLLLKWVLTLAQIEKSCPGELGCTLGALWLP